MTPRSKGSILGIDPGASGGLALVTDLCSAAWKMQDTERDLWNLIREMWTPDTFAYIERVSAMPKQGVSSTFKFGQNYGMLRGMLVAAGIPFETVSPSVWQGALGCRTKGDKNVTKRRAQELFPSLTITHATADALLIAEYGRRLRHG